MMATMVPVRCLICGDCQIPISDLSLVANEASVDYAFTHCDTETRRYATPDQVRVALALGVRVIHPSLPDAHCRRCGCRRFEIAAGVYACRNCDVGLPGLPPSDREVAR